MSEIHDMLPIRIDETTTAGVTYIQYVDKGNPNDFYESNSSILMIDETIPGITLFKWANGDKTFTNKWASRASYTYLPLKR